MAVCTSDILLEGVRRDQVFEWLSDRANHAIILDGAFDDLRALGPGDFDLTVKSQGKARTLEYRYDRPDDSHGGRRILVNTGGKRFGGKLHYSLRTMKPSTNTLVTVHMDYDAGAVIGALLNSAGLNKELEARLAKILANLSRAVPRER
jgi:hypothetical protein